LVSTNLRKDSDVLVLGGGNEAVAAAQTALRRGARHVTIACETAREGMPCFSEWVAEAEAEGVKLSPGVRPVRIEEAGEGRLRAVLQRGHETLCIEADRILAAPVRRVDTARFKALGLNVTGRGIAADRQTFATNLEGVFAAGEAVGGPGAGVRAVAAGRLAAASIHRFLSGGTAVAGERKVVNVLMGKLSEKELSALFRDVARAPRARAETSLAKVSTNQEGRASAPVRKVSGFDEVTTGLFESEAVREASRCIQCDCLAQSTCALRRYATEYGAEPAQYRGERRAIERDASHPEIVYESGKCILCGLCVRIAEQAGERPGITFKGRGFPTVAAVPFGRPISEGLARSGALCAAACPTGALALKRNASKPAC
jgi:formate dehydrogenase major subunit